MRKVPFNIILLGDPAAGKGTQAVRLIKRYRLYDLDMGREIRKPAVRRQFNYAKTTGIGKLTPTGVVQNIFKKSIMGVPPTAGILFNGTPKMIGEAKLVHRLLKKSDRTHVLVIYLTLPEAEMIKRANKRHRDDDDARGLRNRRRYYKVQMSQVVKFFRKQYTLKTVSGMGTEAAVAQKIDRIIKDHFKNHGA